MLDNFSTGNRANLDGLDVEIVEGELRSYERVHTAVRGVEVVYHLGALGSVPRSVQDPLTTSAVNVEGTLNVLLAARDEGVRRVVFASSSSVYGSAATLPRARTAPADPISPYGVAKLAAERYCVSFSRVYEPSRRSSCATSTSSARARTRTPQYAAVVPLFITAIAARRPVTIFGDGEQSRDFTYVDERRRRDNLRAADAEGANGRIFNIAAGAPRRVDELADTIGSCSARTSRRCTPTPRPGDIRDSWADVDRGPRGPRLGAASRLRGGPAADRGRLLG